MRAWNVGILLLLSGGCTGTVSGEPDSSTGSRDAARLDATTTDAGALVDAGEGSSDAGGIDAATPDAAPPSFDCASAIYCDDFERYAPGAAPTSPWTASENAGSVIIDDTRAVSGSRALRFTTDDGTGTYRRAFAVLEGSPVFPAASTEMYGRMRMWLVAVPVGSVHWTNIQAEGDVTGMGFRAFYRYGGQHDGRIMANYETSGVSTDCWDHSATVMPTGRWACVEWHYRTSGDEMDLWLDGAPLDDVSIRGVGEGCGGHDTGDHWYAPVFDRLSLGWEHYQETPMKEMWIDDLAIDDARVGCD
jgi:hypothetical protein